VKLEFVPISHPRFTKGDRVREKFDKDRYPVSGPSTVLIVDAVDGIDGWCRCVWNGELTTLHSWWFAPETLEFNT
jgi:hypothetical protein